MDRIQEKLNELWVGTIQEFEYNVIMHTIKMQIIVLENNIKKNYEVIFKGVSSCYCVENTRDRRHNLHAFYNGDFLEVSSLWYFKYGIGDICINSITENWANQYGSNANFCLEVWDAMIFIESNCVVINNESNDVDYP